MSTEKKIIKELENGLILRHARREDAEVLAKFNGEIHADRPDEDFADYLAIWTRDLMTRPHPTFRPEDFTIVEDPKTGQIVSCLNLIDQTWSYSGIEFGVGRIELVATLEEYRRQGLVRLQMDTVHQWSEERGHKLQSITGIPWFYRKFGYGMCLELGGGRLGDKDLIPKLKKDNKEPYLIRRAAKKDIPFISQLYTENLRRDLLTCIRDEAHWEYEIEGRSPGNANIIEIRIIESTDGEPLGYLMHPDVVWEGSFYVKASEVAQGHSWMAVTPSVLWYINETGEEYVAKDKNKDAEFNSFRFNLGSEHPVFEVIPHLLPKIIKPYAWYIRLPNILDFLQLISPVLEERIAKSYLSGHIGEIKLGFYASGIRMEFEDGKIKTLEPWENPEWEKASALFPDLTFLQLIFGYRDIDDLNKSFADSYPLNADAAVLLRVLFPRQHSDLLPVD